jgi:hypothetical protein
LSIRWEGDVTLEETVEAIMEAIKSSLAKEENIHSEASALSI